MENVIFDWKRTLYNPENKQLINGAVEILKAIKDKNIPIILIGKGGDDMNSEVDRLQVRDYFQEIVFALGEKDPEVFAKYISKYNPKDTFVIGDRVRSELEIANKLGATTVWVKQGKFADELPESENQKPDFIVPSLSEVLKFFKD